MNWSDARGRLNPYLDGELEMDENVQVLRHLEGCTGCSTRFESERGLFDDIRRVGSVGAAPAGLRDRIAGQIAQARTAARPWPFARALVPAAAAAVLLAVFVTFFTAQPLESMARRAVAWHEGAAASVVPVSTAPQLASFYDSKGIKACIHEERVNEKMSYAYKSACVDKSGPGGCDIAWWVAACPKSGCRMSHACFPVPPSFEKVWPDGKRKTFHFGDKTVFMNHRNGQVCLFVFDNSKEADRFLTSR